MGGLGSKSLRVSVFRIARPFRIPKLFREILTGRKPTDAGPIWPGFCRAPPKAMKCATDSSAGRLARTFGAAGRRWNAVISPPTLDRQFFQRGVVRSLRIGRQRGAAENIGDVVGQHRGNGVDGLVAVDALLHQTLERLCRRRLVAERSLVFDDDVQGCVQSQVRKADARPAMIVLDQSYALRLVQFQPLFRGRRPKRIIAFQHGKLPPPHDYDAFRLSDFKGAVWRPWWLCRRLFGSLQSKSHQVRSIRGFSSKRLSIGRVVTGREHRTHISRAGEALLQRYAVRP